MAFDSGLQLRVIEGKNKGRVVALEHDQITLGRAAKKSERAPKMIFFNEPTVSRIHAVLKWQKRKKRYLLEHKSRTNPTLVDGTPVEKKLLDLGSTIQMGLLVVCLEKADAPSSSRSSSKRSGRLGQAVQKPKKPPTSVVGPILEALSEVERQRKEPPPQRAAPVAREPKSFGWEPPPKKASGQTFSVTPEQTSSEGGDWAYGLLVAEGPDKGANFPLEEMVLVIGHREGFDDPRGGQGILLNDDSLPSEQGMLVWQNREATYGLLQSDSSRVPMAVRRLVGGSPREIPVDRQRPTLLEEGDVILLGRSALVVKRSAKQKATSPEPPARAGLMMPQSEPEPRPSPFRRTGGGSGPAPPSAAEEEVMRGQAVKPISLSPQGNNDETIPQNVVVAEPAPIPEQQPVWARRTQVPGNESLSGRETLGRGGSPGGAGPAPKQVRKGAHEPQPPLAWPWKRNFDFVFDFLSGPNQGCQVPLTQNELPEGSCITIGSSGDRVNNIVIDSFGVSNEQATLRFREGHFTLLNEGQNSSMMVNATPLKNGDQVVLMTGDRMEIGDSVICFLERKVVDSLSQFRLTVESGVAADQDKEYAFSKQRIQVGRGKGCEVRLSDLEVSRGHVTVVFREDQFYIQHRSETNPTFLNGVSLLPGAERKLNPGDRIRLSSLTVLRFVRLEANRRRVVHY